MLLAALLFLALPAHALETTGTIPDLAIPARTDGIACLMITVAELPRLSMAIDVWGWEPLPIDAAKGEC